MAITRRWPSELRTPLRTRRGPVGLWLLLTLALTLRVWKLTDKNPGLDESTSWHLATRPLGCTRHWITCC
jgi:hypothetical protein